MLLLGFLKAPVRSMTIRTSNTCEPRFLLAIGIGGTLLADGLTIKSKDQEGNRSNQLTASAS